MRGLGIEKPTGASVLLLGQNAVDEAVAVAELLLFELVSLQEGEPEVAKRGAFGHDQVFAQLETTAIAGDECGSVVEVVDRVDVRAVADGGPVEEGVAMQILVISLLLL